MGMLGRKGRKIRSMVLAAYMAEVDRKLPLTDAATILYKKFGATDCSWDHIYNWIVKATKAKGVERRGGWHAEKRATAEQAVAKACEGIRRKVSAISAPELVRRINAHRVKPLSEATIRQGVILFNSTSKQKLSIGENMMAARKLAARQRIKQWQWRMQKRAHP
ncbi:MAG: hypothetical protein HY544_02280 [Candidatus Diapherotrites archaeon]|uniref:Uncharacterized protein n=1 Tax=Candidatus Iainarchaeum sp. TaxID=3101447 RepID=A0A8T3YKI3_9ARCH|nr:hypothetical protein [Candidatus Diapherotrites archaeon]